MSDKANNTMLGRLIPNQFEDIADDVIDNQKKEEAQANANRIAQNLTKEENNEVINQEDNNPIDNSNINPVIQGNTEKEVDEVGKDKNEDVKQEENAEIDDDLINKSAIDYMNFVMGDVEIKREKATRSFWLPIDTLEIIDTMAEKSNKTANKFLSEFLDKTLVSAYMAQTGKGKTIKKSKKKK